MSDLKVSYRKLSEIRPCDFCGGKIAPAFRVIQVKFGGFNQQATNETLALAHGFGLGLGIAEVMGARADQAVFVAEQCVVELFACTECYCKPLDIAVACERVNNAK